MEELINRASNSIFWRNPIRRVSQIRSQISNLVSWNAKKMCLSYLIQQYIPYVVTTHLYQLVLCGFRLICAVFTSNILKFSSKTLSPASILNCSNAWKFPIILDSLSVMYLESSRCPRNEIFCCPQKITVFTIKDSLLLFSSTLSVIYQAACQLALFYLPLSFWNEKPPRHVYVFLCPFSDLYQSVALAFH